MAFFFFSKSYFDTDEDKTADTSKLKEYQPLSSESSESEDELDAFMAGIEVFLISF